MMQQNGMEKDNSDRSQSLASSTLLTTGNNGYDKVDINGLYEYILKIMILEYRNEARFKTPIIDNSIENNGAALSTTSSPSKKNRRSRIYDLDNGNEPRLSSSVYNNLEQHLNLIAMRKRGSKLDDGTRRSLLGFYSQLLDPKVKSDLKGTNTPDYLLMKFVSCANKEITKLGTYPSSEVSNIAFKQANEFVLILIKLVEREKNADAIINKLNSHKDSLNPKRPSLSNTSSSSSVLNAKYHKPSFRITDFDQGLLNLISSLFHYDTVKIQQDIFKLKDFCQEKALHADIKQVLFYLEKDLGKFKAKSFIDDNLYHEWKAREKSSCDNLMNKYPVPHEMKLMLLPKLPSGEDFYILPPSTAVGPYLVILYKLCIMKQNQDTQNSTNDEPLLSKQANQLVNLCSKIWLVDYPTRAVLLFTASHISGILRDSLYKAKDPKELAPVNIDKTIEVFHYCKLIIEDQGKLSWEDKEKWSFKDQDEWIKNLTNSYNETMHSIKESLYILFSKVVKPKFGPSLMFLGEYLESDVLFLQVEQSGLIKKWEKKLSKSLLRVAEMRYAELLENLPRDNTLSIMHVLDISDNIVNDIKFLQKRYKNPLLGFLNVSRTVATVVTSMFAADSRNILKHIEAYAKNNGEFIPYGDALEAYKSLFEIRNIYTQVSTTKSPFKFNLEKFFFSYLNDWVDESGEKIQQIVEEAIKKDNFEPIDIDDDNKKYSTSVLDVFSLVREFLNILEKLHWSNEYQLAKIYTVLLKNISEGVLKYTSSISDRIIFELNEEEQRKLLEMSKDKAEKRKSGSWFDEMKTVVNNIQQAGSKIETEEPYNFKPHTCVALNNLAAMLQQLTQLEEILDPEMILNTVKALEPNRQNYFTSHIFSLRLVKAENLASNGSSSSNIRPYVTMIDTFAKKTIGKTRTINHNANPEWDEEFEMTLEPNSSLTISVTVWDEKVGTHSICGRAMLQLDPKRFKHDGIPQEVFLDLDSQGRLLVEVAVESERMDAIFVMGRAHRSLIRAQERCIKLIVEKFSRFIHLCFSRSNLKSVCGSAGNVKPSQDQMDNAMLPLYDYLNSNLQVLAEYLTKDLLLKVMLAAWKVVVASADELLLPKLVTAKTFSLSTIGSKLSSNQSNHHSNSNNGWQSAVSSAVSNVTNSMGVSGFGKQLTHNELETVFAWLNFLCFDFFHNDGNGPPVRDLKNDHYQSLLLLPVYYDRDIHYLQQEVERLSPAFIKSLRDRNNFDINEVRSSKSAPDSKPNGLPRSVSRVGTMVKSKTITANATAKTRADAARDVQDARSDPIWAQTSAEDIILRLLLIKDEKIFVSKRLEQREKLARSIATERLAKAAAEGRFRHH